MGNDKKLAAVRTQMKDQGITAYIQPMHDAYMSEYPPACFKRIEWLTGFSGSAGTVVITANKAVLFTDGRYTLQASQQVDKNLFTCINSGDLAPETWLVQELSEGVVGYDSELFTPAMMRRAHAALAKKSLGMKAVTNTIDAVWSERPEAPATPVFLHDERYAGMSAHDKCQAVAQHIKAQQADGLFITAPDSICWLLNIRAHDTECTPLALCRALLYADGRVHLFIDPARLPELPNFIEALPPELLDKHLQMMHKKTLLVDESNVPSTYITRCEQAEVKLAYTADPCQLMKAIKNPAQLQAIRQAHIADGAAVAKLLRWLDTHPDIHSVSEMEIDEKLLSFRKEHPDFVEPSFPTIAGSGPHGAIVHYRADTDSNRHLAKGELLLLDSGGQYVGGTTDITRTIAIGTPDAEQKKHFTLVLKGHIALATARFPKGTRGSQLDALARQFLWQHGLDYDHGTGHGVGQFLGVHEGPQRISKRGGNDAVLEVGMILSNEPGYYKEGAYGIRIENLVVVAEKENGFLGFDTITCAPLETKLIDETLLTDAEKKWLADYHYWVTSQLAPLL